MALPFSFVAAPVAAPSKSSVAPAAGFVPHPWEISLGGSRASDVVCRSRLGGVVLSSASLSGGVLRVFLADGRVFKCLVSCFDERVPEDLLASIRWAVHSRSPVWLWVAVGPGGRAAREHFCGLWFSGPSVAEVAPEAGVCSGF